MSFAYAVLAAVHLSIAFSAPAFSQSAVLDPMAPLPNPMTVTPLLPNPMAPTPTAPTTGTSAMPAPTMPNPMPQGGGVLNPMVATPPAAGEEVALRADLGNLPDTPGVEDTYFLCTACHSAQTFAQLRVTDARWEYLWDWMISDQNMPDYGPEARETILAYLKTHFSSER
jgi:hypothetical protein